MRLFQGSSLVEVTIALLVGVMLLGLVVTLLWRAVVTMTRSDERVDPRERAHLALATMRCALADSWYYRVTATGVSFHGPGKDGDIQFDRTRNRLRYRPAGQPFARDLLSANVTGFTVTALKPGYLRLTLTIARPKRTGALAPLGELEAVEEVYIPSVARRDPAVPWNRAMEHRKAMEPVE